jgi:5'-methylthioadenosine phosphorylase
MRFNVAIIGGTGVGKRLIELGGTPVHIPTPTGTVRGRHLHYEGVDLLLLSRHSAGHKVPPHKVNYQGIATAVASLGIKHCLASAAVGSLRRDWGPGTFVACSDFLDFTFRNTTMFDATVIHTDFTQPFSPEARAAFVENGKVIGLDVNDAGVYLAGNGPRYETPEEIRLYEKLGAHVVGMTATSEAIVMRESGIKYGCLAIVTNLAAGISKTELSHEEVEDEMNRSGAKAVQILLASAKQLAITAN